MAASSPVSGSTSAGGMCTTRTGTRSWSTGARRSPARSTGPARPTPWDWSCAAGSGFPGASSPRTKTRCSPAARRPAAARRPRSAVSSSRRSSGRGPGRCATSWPPSPRTRTTSSGPGPTTHSACRVHPAPGRPRSACTGSRTCCTPTPAGWPGAGSWSSGRTAPSSPTSVMCCPPSARSTSPRPPWPTCWPGCRSGPGTASRPRASRGTPGWPRCCTGRCGPGCVSPPSRSSWSAGPGAGGSARVSWPGSSRNCGSAASVTAPAGRCWATGSPTSS